MGNEFERLTENGIVIGDNEEEATYGEELDEDWSDCLLVFECRLYQMMKVNIVKWKSQLRNLILGNLRNQCLSWRLF